MQPSLRSVARSGYAVKSLAAEAPSGHTPRPLPAAARVPTMSAAGAVCECSISVAMSGSARFALIVNTVAEVTNGLVYLLPRTRNKALPALFGIPSQDSLSPLSGAFATIGGLHGAIAIQCVLACFGLRSGRETLAGMAIVHAMQFVIGLQRMLASMAKGKATTWEARLGAGGGPALGAAVLGLLSFGAIM